MESHGTLKSEISRRGLQSETERPQNSERKRTYRLSNDVETNVTDLTEPSEEEEEYRTAYLTVDCVLLWTLIRKTHLTRMYGDSDPMKEVNRHEQESKYGWERAH